MRAIRSPGTARTIRSPLPGCPSTTPPRRSRTGSIRCAPCWATPRRSPRSSEFPASCGRIPWSNTWQQHGYATWSLDFLADDWTHINAKEITRRALQRIEARGRGILLLHDIQPATALALPTILAELKARGYKIVQVVPATADRPATVAELDDWVQRHRTRPSWPRVLAVGTTTAQPSLDAPSPENFGVTESTGKVVAMDLSLAMAAQQERPAAGQNPLPRSAPWPNNVSYTVPAQTELLPMPAAQDFIYYPGRSTASFAASGPQTPRDKIS